MPQKSQPMGLVGRREAISAPTIGNASESTPVSTAKPGPGLSPGSPAGMTSPVRKSSKRASPTRATQTAHSDQANHAAVLWFIGQLPRLCCLVPSVTIPLYSATVSQTLRQTLRGSFSEPRRAEAPKDSHTVRLSDVCLYPWNWRRILRGGVRTQQCNRQVLRPTPTAYHERTGEPHCEGSGSERITSSATVEGDLAWGRGEPQPAQCQSTARMPPTQHAACRTHAPQSIASRGAPRRNPLCWRPRSHAI